MQINLITIVILKKTIQRGKHNHSTQRTELANSLFLAPDRQDLLTIGLKFSCVVITVDFYV